MKPPPKSPQNFRGVPAFWGSRKGPLWVRCGLGAVQLRGLLIPWKRTFIAPAPAFRLIQFSENIRGFAPPPLPLARLAGPKSLPRIHLAVELRGGRLGNAR